MQPSSFGFEKINQFIRESITIKLLVIGFLILILLIPVALVEELIDERKGRQEEVELEVSDTWASEQIIGGPFLSIPYTDYFETTETSEHGYINVMPVEFDVVATITPEIRKRGIFEVPVYTSSSDVRFSFDGKDIKLYSNRTYEWDKMMLAMGLSDLKGVAERVSGLAAGDSLVMLPGTPNDLLFERGISSPVSVRWSDTLRPEIAGTFNLKLRGSKSLKFIPVGTNSHVQMTSSWKDPSFVGQFLPSDRKISDEGFTAEWNVLEYNRSFSQIVDATTEVTEDAFGVTLFNSVNHYHKSERSAKYAVLLIALTFILFFFSQAINKISIHPFQYFLVGLALCLFYTLLLSLSEHIGFNSAYWVAAVMILSIISWYMRQILGSPKFTLMTTLILSGLYVYIFVLLQLEDYALLIGSLGLFVILSIIMWLSMKLNWSGSQK